MFMSDTERKRGRPSSYYVSSLRSSKIRPCCTQLTAAMLFVMMRWVPDGADGAYPPSRREIMAVTCGVVRTIWPQTREHVISSFRFVTRI